MTSHRWAISQRAVEAALTRGPKTIRQIQDETSLSYTNIKNCLARARVTTEGWPKVYSLIASAFDNGWEDEEETAAVREVVKLIHVVTPVEIQMEEVGPRWQANAAKLGEEIAAIDLQTMDLKKAIRHLEIEAASILGVIIALRDVKDGPDWREQIGLTP